MALCFVRGPGLVHRCLGAGVVEVETFSGPHPLVSERTPHFGACEPRTFCLPFGGSDAIAIGELVSTGILNPGRVVALAGPSETLRLLQPFGSEHRRNDRR